MDLLLDINVAADVCTRRQPFYQDADLALAKCLYEGGRLWRYAGSVQTLEYVTRQELQQRQRPDAPPPSAKQLARQARNLLKALAADKQWLAALAGEGDVFDSDDPEDAQLIRALTRFLPGAIQLLTRDQALIDAYPGKTLTPAQSPGSVRRNSSAWWARRRCSWTSSRRVSLSTWRRSKRRSPRAPGQFCR